MSRHAQLSPEAEQKLRAQKRNSTISAVIISLLACSLLVAILFYIALTPLFKNTEELVTYSSSNSDSEEKVTKPEMNNEVEKKPSAPSASMAKVIASNTPSPTAVPVPDVVVTEPSLDFGDGNDFGDGWGGGGSGSGSGGGGGVSFFKQSVKAERVAYVIDYSASMRGKKFELMKKELADSVKKLPDSVEYQLIFFAGPVWLASDEVHGDASAGKAISFTRDGKKYDWKRSKGIKNLPRAEWIKADKDQLKSSLKAIKSNPMVYGTRWDLPIEYALDMKPKPDIIFFMTDGTAGSNTDTVAKRIAKEAKKQGVIINCVALMEPKAKDAMAHVAQETGGIFTEVQENGRTKEHKPEKKK